MKEILRAHNFNLGWNKLFSGETTRATFHKFSNEAKWTKINALLQKDMVFQL